MTCRSAWLNGAAKSPCLVRIGVEGFFDLNDRVSICLVLDNEINFKLLPDTELLLRNYSFKPRNKKHGVATQEILEN
jgi:hypothetical protein